MRRLAIAVPIIALSVMALGSECEEDPTGDPIRDVDRSAIDPSDDDAWASSPWTITDPETEGLIEIEPGTRIKLYHGLGHAPVEVHAYVGFAEDESRVMPASGNAVEIHEVGTDDGGDYVVIRNGSGGSFYYRFVLR